jgi:hypothetical protein
MPQVRRRSHVQGRRGLHDGRVRRNMSGGVVHGRGEERRRDRRELWRVVPKMRQCEGVWHECGLHERLLLSATEQRLRLGNMQR